MLFGQELVNNYVRKVGELTKGKTITTNAIMSLCSV